MGYFQIRYDSRVINYEHKLFIRLATLGHSAKSPITDEQTLKLYLPILSLSGVAIAMQFLHKSEVFRNSPKSCR